jgi:hypothetical protein
MNDESKLTDDQLRLATSRSLLADSALDADTSAARDSFLGLGSAVESAARDFDETALINRLTTTCVSSPVKPARDWLWPLIVTGALAAGMLLAIARIAAERKHSNDHAPVANFPTRQAPAETIPIVPITTVAWNDPLDDEIALAAATIHEFSGTDRGFDGSLLDMNDQLQALSRELLGETL